jgi:hypothetical protein
MQRKVNVAAAGAELEAQKVFKKGNAIAAALVANRNPYNVDPDEEAALLGSLQGQVVAEHAGSVARPPNGRFGRGGSRKGKSRKSRKGKSRKGKSRKGKSRKGKSRKSRKGKSRKSRKGKSRATRRR